ncbi:bifunctional adenosylcobinamide kinase/adenosylcobinamide-phosphate guanylyltransferase [Sulfitobacter sp. F26204]|uniref:bifunctional adenosylcobinamide kinase/adenosylcobinamide-phosphate guanylyltransferase n=1 Tax=Sulfitobacter sp. F26204 TaxID=2996014 RepID=UPI002B2195E5|nr:bifunctional adenosylcobinamide kinase/adenosylcobinamide-phosphate guanylyltransferase [Sulfitobacter sp. F26204]
MSTFVLGGAASGKSLWAERLAESYDRPLTYIATGQIFDDEVAARVQIHKNRRDDRWVTVEEPLDLTATLTTARSEQVLLIDCATMWLSNHMMAGNDLAAAQAALIKALQTCPATWVIVSNEVGHGIVPDNKLARQFREAQGRLNIALAAEATLAVMVVAGLPQVLKGSLP